MELARLVMEKAEAGALWVARIFVSLEDISDALKKERAVLRMEESPFAYELKNLDTLHARAGALISHLSIMLALCMFIVGQEGWSNRIGYPFVVFDMVIYLILLLMAVVVLRPVGFDFGTGEAEKYKEYMARQISKKHAVIRSVAAGTILATTMLLAAFAAILVEFFFENVQ